VNLRDSYARVDDGEVWIYNVHINPYSHRGYADHQPTRKRKLLLHRQEIRKLIGRTVEREDHPTVRGLVNAVRHLVKVDG